MYDVIVCGSGPAGMAAAITLKRANLNIIIIEKGTPGGKLNEAMQIENYLGFEENFGVNLALKMYKQLKGFNIPYKTAEVTKVIKQDDNNFLVYTNDAIYETKNVIWAAGSINKKLNVENEKRFIGKGISYCAVCDGSLSLNKNVVVIGNGDSALESAIYLSRICNKITIIMRNNKLHAEEYLIDKVKNNEKIELIHNHEIVSFNGNDTLEKITIKNCLNNTIKELLAPFAYIHIGFIPANIALEEFDILDEEKYIIVDKNGETKIKGLYAAGDCTSKEIKQIITAVYDGTICASAIIKSI